MTAPANPRRRPVLPWIAVALVVTVVASVSWWNIAASRARIQAGSFWADQSWNLQAGGTTEFCFPYQVGNTIRFGFDVINPGSHNVRVTQIDQGFLRMPQDVFVNPTLDDDLSFRPFTLRPGAHMMLDVVVHIPADPGFGPGKHAWIEAMTFHYRVLGRNFVRPVPLNFAVGVQMPEAGKTACAPDPPVGA
jgi:hypothetical protein